MYYIEKDQNGEEIVRFDINKKYTKKELRQQRNEAERLANEGKKICLTDLFINSGM